jgi:D-glycero-D-manno-heptose 1,7-bisphosphate phosphatase
MRPAVFLDRDGTLIEDVDYLRHPEDIVLFSGAAEVIRRLNEERVPVILISNQSGIGRGFMTADDLRGVQKRLAELLAWEGCRLDACYFCPHHPEASCACRKPSPMMLFRAAEEMAIDLSASCIIGDKASDIEAGRLAGCRTVLVLTGCGRDTANAVPDSYLVPDHIAPDISGAWPWLRANLVHRDSGSAAEITPFP